MHAARHGCVPPVVICVTMHDPSAPATHLERRGHRGAALMDGRCRQVNIPVAAGRTEGLAGANGAQG
jgi:hypothetical protein